MAGKPQRSQLNQIRAWVREGRTDAWIAHQLEISASDLREFRRRHDLTPDSEADDASDDLRDEIEAEVEAATRAAEEEAEAEAEETDDGEDDAGEDEPDRDEERPRRRRRRGGRGRRRRGGAGATIEASFDHGEDDGYGLWLDPAVKDNPVYAEHWAGHRPVKVTVEADRIVIRRA